MLSPGLAVMTTSLYKGRLFNRKGLCYFTLILILLSHFRKADIWFKEEHVIKSLWSSPESEILVEGFLFYNRCWWGACVDISVHMRHTYICQNTYKWCWAYRWIKADVIGNSLSVPEQINVLARITLLTMLWLFSHLLSWPFLSNHPVKPTGHKAQCCFPRSIMIQVSFSSCTQPSTPGHSWLRHYQNMKILNRRGKWYILICPVLQK